jgi:hypothetical protein
MICYRLACSRRIITSGENLMAAFGDLIAIVVVGFIVVAGLSLLTIGVPVTPPFARSAQKLDRAHMLLNVEEGQAPRARGRREPIPREVRRAVFERDGGKCAHCGSNFDLQYDHVIPVALGGATTIGNLQLLCGDCNREKGADL